MATVGINVAVSPKGTSIAQGVQFAFSPGVGTPAGVVGTDGLIDLSKQYAKGTAVSLAFQITTPNITFTTGTSIGTFPLSFYASTNGAKDACWIALKGQNPSIYGGTEFVFASNALGPGNGTVTVLDNNNDGLQYAYALWIWIATNGTQGTRFEDDPRIINHPT